MENKSLIKVMIADDHQIFMVGLATLFKESNSIDLVYKASNGKEILEALKKGPVDIILMDIAMPEMDGIETTKYISAHYPNVKVVALSMHNQVAQIVKMLQAGAKGYLLKHADKEEILKAIKTVYNNDIYYSPEVAVNLVNKIFKEGVQSISTPQNLTDREIEIIKLVVAGELNKQIAAKLYVSEATIKTHRQRILHKLGLQNTAELLHYAHEKNIV